MPIKRYFDYLQKKGACFGGEGGTGDYFPSVTSDWKVYIYMWLERFCDFSEYIVQSMFPPSFFRTSQILTPPNWIASKKLVLQPRAESGMVYDCEIL